MKVIKGAYHICVPKDGNEFHKQLKEAIDEMQKAGLEVEIQYQNINTAADYAFTAVVLGRKEE